VHLRRAHFDARCQRLTDAIGASDPEKEQRYFDLNGSRPEQMRLLQERFGIAVDTEVSITQLHSARKCLPHDLGIVAPTRCNAEGIFVMRWTAFDRLAIGHETGNEKPLADLLVSGITGRKSRCRESLRFA
jgi:hypothetical protein